MRSHSRPGRRRAAFALTTTTALVLAGAASASSYAVGHTSSASTDSHAVRGKATGDARGFYDSRYGTGIKARSSALRNAGAVSRQPAVRQFVKGLAGETVLDIDGTTGTVRMLSRLDGFLTGKSKKPAAKIALGYVRANAATLGLTAADLSTFHLKRDYRDITGAHHLFFVQRIQGKTVLSNGLTASVNKQGHLLTVGGSPISKANLPRVVLPSSPRLGTATAALAAARRTTSVTPGASLANDSATEGLFVTPSGVHLAWQTVVMSAKTPAMVTVDASTGAVLQRRPLTDDANGGDASGKVYKFFPGSKRGGKAVKVDFTKKGWLGKHARKLSGNNSHAYSDVNDDNRANKSEEVHPTRTGSFQFGLKPFHLPWAKSFCSNPWPCSWNPNKPYSWKKNRAQNATQVFFFVNNWHDHLKAAPIGFTEAAGNFQVKNKGKAGKGHDAVDTQTDDGANTDHGLPDGNHIDNANMSTPPDGTSPTMQMYLQHAPHTSYPKGDPFSPTNVGDEADTVYHEYTHGLSNRLNVDVQDASTLGGVQAGAMGEAWSDWYAMDYLVAQHLQQDKRGKVDVRLFKYDGAGVALDRTEPIDCPVGSKAKLCNGGDTGRRGGYTYADYGQVIGMPEVHSDGEIWAQTLWSLRDKLGSKKTEALVTRAMELAPYDPSFLDMRNAILVADTSVLHGKGRATIWKVFASRGMGFTAGSLGGEDATPAASFSTPPKHLTVGSISGTVTDGDSGQPVAGVPVTLAFQGRGVANPTATTDAAGHYTLSGIPDGRYTKLVVNGTGYEPVQTAVTVSGTTPTDASFTVRRDWAAASGGAEISDANGIDFSAYGCGPVNAIDLSQANGWSTNTGPGSSDQPSGTFAPKHITIALNHTVNISAFAVNPTATCGDGASASTGGYTIETSPDGTTWTTAATGTFTATDLGRLNTVVPTAGNAGVRYVRFTITSNQTPSFSTSCPTGAYSGCTYTDLTEVEVYGTGIG